jgi:hypothetical protein
MRLILTIFFSLLFNFSYSQSVVHNWSSGCGTYSSEAQAAIDELPTTPSCGMQDAIAAMVDRYVTAGMWADAEQCLLLNAEIEANSLVDISGNNNDATEVGSLTFTSTVGWKGVGSGENYINTGWRDTDATVCGDEDCGYFAFVQTDDTNGSGVKYLFGARDSQSPDKSQVSIFDDRGGELDGRMHDDGGAADIASVDIMDNLIYGVIRQIASSNALWLRYETTNSVFNASSGDNGGLCETEIYLLALNQEGTTAFQTDAELGYWIILEGTAMNSDVAEFMDIIGDYIVDVDAL